MLSIIHSPFHTFYSNTLKIIPEITARITRTDITFMPERPIFFARAVSVGRLWQNDSMIAKIDISLRERLSDAMAPTAAYIFTALPITRTIAASPGKPKKPITGANISENQLIIGVCLRNVTIK